MDNPPFIDDAPYKNLHLSGMSWDFTLIFRNDFLVHKTPIVQPWLHSVVGLHRPAAVGMLVATERGQQRGAQ